MNLKLPLHIISCSLQDLSLACVVLPLFSKCSSNLVLKDFLFFTATISPSIFFYRSMVLLGKLYIFTLFKHWLFLSLYSCSLILPLSFMKRTLSSKDAANNIDLIYIKLKIFYLLEWRNRNCKNVRIKIS